MASVSPLNIDDSFIQQKEDENNKRYYEVTKPNSKVKLPSVSTLCNFYTDKTGLTNWANKLGYEQLVKEVSKEKLDVLSKEEINKLSTELGLIESRKVTNAAASRGTRVHQLCEDYYTKGVISDDYCFQRLLPFIKITEYLAVETKVKYELVLDNGESTGWAGRFDNIGYVDTSKLKNHLGEVLGNTKVPAIIDYKTWNRPKYNKGSSSDGKTYYPLLTYYLQLTAYLAAFNQCKYYDVLIKDCFLVGVTETSRDCWIYYLNLDKVNFMFRTLKQIAEAYHNQQSFNWQELEENVEPYLAERVWLLDSKTKLPF